MDTGSEDWRHICEVKFIARMPTRDDRKRYLAGVKKHRGDAAAQRIIADLRAMLDQGAE